MARIQDAPESLRDLAARVPDIAAEKAYGEGAASRAAGIPKARRRR
jgi:hypothetical protein